MRDIVLNISSFLPFLILNRTRHKNLTNMNTAQISRNINNTVVISKSNVANVISNKMTSEKRNVNMCEKISYLTNIHIMWF